MNTPTPPIPAKKSSSLGSTILWFINAGLLMAVIGGILVAYLAFNYFKSPGILEKETTVVVPQGSSLTSITNLLAENQVLDKPFFFALAVRFTESGKKMRAGEYLFKPHVSPMQVFEDITNGNVVVRNVTVPEGLMTFQILDIIRNTPFLTGDVPGDVKEGELLPETYDYMRGDSRAKIINRMREAMKKTLDEAWEKRKADLPLHSKEEVLVLASIVEKETGIASERERVAAVFINRLRQNMRLQTDPTVIYAVTQGKSVLDRPLTYNDLKMESPYNTYTSDGLPPGPIANPGRAAIFAATTPLDSTELYFVADGTGGHRFSSTLKEHNDNVLHWRKVNKEAATAEKKAP